MEAQGVQVLLHPPLPLGIAGIVVEFDRRFAPPAIRTAGRCCAFHREDRDRRRVRHTDGGRDIQQGLIDYVADFTAVAAGKEFNPHVTIGVAPETYLNQMFAEPFKAFAFSLAGTAVY